MRQSRRCKCSSWRCTPPRAAPSTASSKHSCRLDKHRCGWGTRVSGTIPSAHSTHQHHIEGLLLLSYVWAGTCIPPPPPTPPPRVFPQLCNRRGMHLLTGVQYYCDSCQLPVCCGCRARARRVMSRWRTASPCSALAQAPSRSPPPSPRYSKHSRCECAVAALTPGSTNISDEPCMTNTCLNLLRSWKLWYFTIEVPACQCGDRQNVTNCWCCQWLRILWYTFRSATSARRL